MSVADPTPVLHEIEAIIAAIDRDARAAAPKQREQAKRRASEARAGRLGPDWHEVQQRIDAGQTTTEDVFGGRDETPAARRLLVQSQVNLTELGELFRAEEQNRVELAEVDRELSEWDPAAAPEGSETTDAPAPDEVSGVRAATDPTTGASGSGAAAPADRHADMPRPGAREPTPPPAGTRNPVANRIDATGLEPPAATDPAGDDGDGADPDLP